MLVLLYLGHFVGDKRYYKFKDKDEKWMWGDGAPQCEPITIFQRWMPDFHTDTDNFFSPLHRYFYKEKIQDDFEEGSY